jgi:hypothetical protein
MFSYTLVLTLQGWMKMKEAPFGLSVIAAVVSSVVRPGIVKYAAET